jgi:hypothetical protein
VRIGAVLDVTTAAGGLLANDTDVDGDTLTVHSVDPGLVTAQGTLDVNTDGTFIFDPHPTAMPGSYRFFYQIIDNGTPSATSRNARVTINITPACEENADLDQNGQVGSADLAILVVNFGSQSATPDQGDLDCDGKVSLTDLVVLKGHWTPASPSALAAAFVQRVALQHDASNRTPRAIQSQKPSALRSHLMVESAVASDNDTAISQRQRATQIRANRRATNHRRDAIDAAFSTLE